MRAPVTLPRFIICIYPILLEQQLPTLEEYLARQSIE
jgi:hypothetical protein